MTERYTPTQGQYLAFIHYYTKVNGQPPAEADMVRYFGTTAPSVHQMVVTLEKKGFIARTPGQSRSIRLLLSRADLPDLGIAAHDPWSYAVARLAKRKGIAA